MDAKNYYVYMYWDLDGTPRYVGMGGTKNRWKSHLTKSDNIWLRRLVSDLKKVGKVPRYAKVAENLTREEACQKEIQLIALYGREGLDRLGTLFNRTLGGDSGAGYARSQSDSERLKRAKTIQVFWDSPKGTAQKLKHSELSRVQMSTPEAKAKTAKVGSSRKGKPGKPQSPEWRAMIGPIVAEANKKRVYTEQDRAHRRRAAQLSVEARRKKKALLDGQSSGNTVSSR